MEKIDLLKDVQVEPQVEYFAQVLNIGIEGKVAGREDQKLIMTDGRGYDLREVIGFGYEATPKYGFTRREIPIGSIRVFRKM